MNKLRIARVSVQVEAFADDGETLTPIPIDPVTVSYGQWAAFDLDDALSTVRDAIEAAPQEPDDTDK